MTSTLPSEVQEVFDRFVTCEYTTVGARQQPITWPVTPYYRPGDATIDVTTGLGYPKKADDARRHPSVSLLFSDPTGSGVESGIQVLVQGTAEVDERNLEANQERYWRESMEKLPGTRGKHPPAFIRRRLGWYYTRIYVQVRPERVFVWPRGEVSAEPDIHGAHLEEVRSGHAEEPVEAHGAPAPGETPWDERMETLGERYERVVVSWLAPDGFPLSVRLPARPDRKSGSIAIEAEPARLPLLEGRACLTAHRHHPDFHWQENFQVRGNLARGPDGWRLVPRRLVGGLEVPDAGFLTVMRENFAKTLRFRRIARRRLRERAG